MSAYIVTDSELVAIANAIRTKNSSNQVFTINQIPAAIASIGENVGSGAVTRTANGNSYIVNETKLVAIANAIRTKLDNNNQMTVAQMPNLIDSIEISQYKEISDSWDTIIANIDNGTYKTKYSIGDYKPLDLGTEGIINMQIVAIDADELADGSGYAPLTFMSMEILTTPSQYATSTSPEKGWESSVIRNYLKTTIKPLIPSTIRNRINSVVKYTKTYNRSTGSWVTNYQTIDDVWIPSQFEVVNAASESIGVQYKTIYANEESRIKHRPNYELGAWWWLRTMYTTSNPFYITGHGILKNTSATQTGGNICLGFCLGLEPETITDDWATILANQNYATDYSIGDTKMLDLGTEGKQLMEIVAFDTDDRADGQGKAGITWISKGLLPTKQKMNADSKHISGYGNSAASGGWQYCDLRNYLINTIMPKIDLEIRSNIVNVSKIQSVYMNNAIQKNGQSTTDSLWIPSMYEISGNTNYESSGARYSKFNSNSTRIKNISEYWLRSTENANNFKNVTSAGSPYTSSYATLTKGIALGFCTN